MANYELPQVRVFQDLEPSIEPSERQMLPAIIGQRRDLFDYDVLAETGKLGDYVMTDDLLADWDGLGANSTVIQNTVRIYGEDLKVSLVKAGFADNIECLSPLHADFDVAEYFSPLVAKQENALVFGKYVIPELPETYDENEGTYDFNGTGGIFQVTSGLVTGAVFSGTDVPDNCFLDQTDLQTIILLDSVTSIGENAFKGCTSLTSIFIHGNAPAVGAGAFEGVEARVYRNLAATGFSNPWGDTVTNLECGPRDQVLTASINLSGSALYRTPEVGDFIKVRQTSPDTVGQAKDWSAQIIGLIETETPRVNQGVGTPAEIWSNAFDTFAEDNSETAHIKTAIAGDKRLGVNYFVTPLQSIGSQNADKPHLSKYQEIGLNAACEGGVFDLADLGYKVRVSDVTSTEVTITVQSKGSNKTYTSPIASFVKCDASDGDVVWFNEDGVVVSGDASDEGNPLGGIMVDNMFLLHAETKENFQGTDTYRQNDITYISVDNNPSGGEAPLQKGDYINVSGAQRSSMNGLYKLTVATDTEIGYENPGDTVGLDGSTPSFYRCTTKNDSFELAGSLERPAQQYSNAGTDVPALTANAKFDSTVDTVYTIEVVEGGAQICSTQGVDTHYPDISLRVSSNNALDPVEIHNPVINWDPDAVTALNPEVTDVTPTGATFPVRIGLKGVEIEFHPTQITGNMQLLPDTAFTATREDTGLVTVIGSFTSGDLNTGDVISICCPDNPSLNADQVEITVGTNSFTYETDITSEMSTSTRVVLSKAADSAFNTIAFAKGDIWNIECTGRSGNEVIGVITDENFPFFEDVDSQRLDVEFMEELRGTTEIPRLQADSIENWEINPEPVDGVEYDLRFISGAQVRVDDVDADLTISDGKVFMAYEAVNNSDTGSILTILDASDKDDELGPDDPRNPLGYGVRKALLNSRGIPVLAVPVDEMEDEDVDDALALLSQNNNAYQITPMTFDESIQNKVVAHVLSMSTETMDLWRRAYISTDIGHEYGIVTVDANNDQVTGTFERNGEHESDPYNKLVLSPSVVGVSFLQSKVKAGHTVRFNYSVDMYGNTTYNEFTVLSVLNATELLVLGDYGSASATMDICVYKDTAADDIIYEVGNRSEGLNSRRVTNVFPSVLVDDNDQAVPGYFAAAALAGLAAGSEPHQGHTNSKLLGFSEASTLAPMRRMDIFSMNELAGKGVTIITGEASNIGIRHELTTAMIDRKNRETMVTRNLDSLSYMYFDALSPFIGIANVTPEFVNKIRTELTSIGNYIISTTKRPLIGSQMTSCTIDSVEQNPVLADKIDIRISPILPLPFNYGDIHLQI